MRILALAYHAENSRMAIYLENLFSELKKEFEVKIVYGELHFLKDTLRFMYSIIKYQPGIIYVTPVCTPTFFVSIFNSILLKKKLCCIMTICCIFLIKISEGLRVNTVGFI